MMELRVADCLEGAHLLVPRLDEAGLVVGPAEGGDQAVDAVAGVAEDLLHVPGPQALEEVVGNSRAHLCSFVLSGSSSLAGPTGFRCPGGAG